MARTKQPTSLKANAPLLWRVLTFLAIFVMVSGLIGPRIISGGIQSRYYFTIYGGGGKALLFGVLAFVLLAYRRLGELKLKPWKPYNLVWLLLAAATFSYAWIGVTRLTQGVHGAYWPVTTHVMLLATVVFAAGGCFGSATIRAIAKLYRRELLIALALAVGFYGFLYAVYGLWEVLAATVLHAVHWMLGIVGLHSVIIAPRTLLFDKFGIDIAQYCSGIESIALFTGLYLVIGVLDWRRFDHKKYAAIFVPALIILFACNILRVFLLILAGYYINPHIAFSLFHTYAGMVFFIIYSGIFWSLAYGWMLRVKKTQQPNVTGEK